MTRDPLGADPLGLDPVQHVQMVKTTGMQRAVDFFRHNVLLRGTTMARTVQPGPALGEDGQPMTLERRRELAAQRAPLDFRKVDTGEIDYRRDNPSIETESLGRSAAAIVAAQPEMTVVKNREAVLRPLTDAERAELDGQAGTGQA